MKKLLILFFPFLLCGSLQAQDYDQRLTKSYSIEELNQIENESPEELVVLNYALNNACYFSILPKGKEISGLNNIELSNTTDVPCFAELGLRIQDQNQYFRISGTDKMLVVKSTWVLKNELQQKKK